MSKNKIGLDITEEEYRALPYPSYSLLSDISKQGAEATINGVRNPDINELDGVMVGKLVDNLVTENKMPDNLIIVKKKPTGKCKDILRVLSRTREYHPNQDELLHKDNHELIHKVCDSLKYFSKSPDKRIPGLENYEDYYNALCNNIEESFIISEYYYYQALKCVKTVRSQYPFLVVPEHYGFELIPQVKLVGEINNIAIKGMLDFILIDHEKKVIYPYDLKTGSGDSKDFIEQGYLGWNYYIQSAIYYNLLKEEIKKHPKYHDYDIYGFYFMHVSRIYNTTKEYAINTLSIEEAMKGFEYDNKYYTGVEALLNEYEYYRNKADNLLKEEMLSNESETE